MKDRVASVNERLTLPQCREALREFVGGDVFDVGGDGPVVAVGVGDAGEAVAVGHVGGSPRSGTLARSGAMNGFTRTGLG